MKTIEKETMQEIADKYCEICGDANKDVKETQKEYFSVESLKELINHIMVIEKCNRLEWLHERLLEELEKN